MPFSERRFAQRSALGLKVSDEYTVPLCNIHHDSLHQTGDERAWWARGDAPIRQGKEVGTLHMGNGGNSSRGRTC